MIKSEHLTSAPLGEDTLNANYSSTFYGGHPCWIDSSGELGLLTCDLAASAGGNIRWQGIFFTCSQEELGYGNGRATFIPMPFTLELGSGYSKHSYTDGYPYVTADAWVAGDRVFLNYAGNWTRTAVGSTVGINFEYGVVEQAPAGDTGMVVRFYSAPRY